ncbi:type IV pilin protein [Chiayiivirga flava]|uniref:Type IV pilus assembly protein PilE n=1 Tax=Chiayiivirga flava TaxID=659595 RepID=A0A7W8DA48_9GAMM|nr:type IV pilin protein [Chiayiivirga flava]MBB5209371.1 type IV pilus assembly protein PilE [Chiayiivirga flava]
MKRRSNASGFTLIELVIVVAIVAILTAIAVPAYNDQVRKSRRADGKAVALQMVQGLERWHTVNNTYAGYAETMSSPSGDPDPHYEITASDLTVTTYTVTAEPQNGQTEDKCGTMTVDQTGAKTPTGGDLDDCW